MTRQSKLLEFGPILLTCLVNKICSIHSFQEITESRLQSRQNT